MGYVQDMRRKAFERNWVADFLAVLLRRREFLHVLIGARQTGKTTAAEQVIGKWRGPVISGSADMPLMPGPEWVETQWFRARQAARPPNRRPVLLVLDEVQKVRGWSESVKRLWDEDSRSRTSIRVLLLGSSSLLVQKGLTESLAGRFFLHRSAHWSHPECRAAFGWSLDEWIFYGGYPGAARLLPDEESWRRYVADALVETAIARDVLQMQTVAKPGLLRNLFGLSSQNPARILSYNKMLGTLQDAGNTVTLAHYLKLLGAAFLVSGLDRVSGRKRMRASSPKIVLWNNALVTAMSGMTYRETRADPAAWGWLVENAAGAHLLNALHTPRFSVGYWRDGNDEIDYVVSAGKKMTGIEIKSGRPGRLSGMESFRRRFPAARTLLVGSGGISLEEFFHANPMDFLDFNRHG